MLATESAVIPNEKWVGEPTLGYENLLEEAAETAFWDLMRMFRNKAQPELEADENSVDEETI